MTKQEKVREQLTLYIKAAQGHRKDPADWADDILIALRSQGVVIMVADSPEPPVIATKEGGTKSFYAGIQWATQNGYTATIPLVEDK